MKEDEDIEEHFESVETIKKEMAEKELGIATIYSARKKPKNKIEWLRVFFEMIPEGYRALYWRIAFVLSRETVRFAESVMVNLTVSKHRNNNKYFLQQVDKAIAAIEKAEEYSENSKDIY